MEKLVGKTFAEESFPILKFTSNVHTLQNRKTLKNQKPSLQ